MLELVLVLVLVLGRLLAAVGSLRRYECRDMLNEIRIGSHGGGSVHSTLGVRVHNNTPLERARGSGEPAF